MSPITPLVKNLLIINVVLFFLITYMFPNWMSYFMAFYPASTSFRPIQIITHMFMHGDMTHIFFNMFMLYMFGSVLENYWGGKFFLLLYLVSGFGALAFHFLVKYISINYYMVDISPELYDRILIEGREVLLEGKNYSNVNLRKINELINIPAVGASGAVNGLLAGFATQFPRQKLMLIFPPIPIEARILIPILIVLELFLGLGARDGIAHFAHIGGAITGFLLVKFKYKINF